jgi:hypothetical protein
MLSLLGDAEAADSGGPVAKLASLPYTLCVEAEETVVGRAGVARMSAGHLDEVPRSQPTESVPVDLRPPDLPTPSTAEGEGGGRT